MKKMFYVLPLLALFTSCGSSSSSDGSNLNPNGGVNQTEGGGPDIGIGVMPGELDPTCQGRDVQFISMVNRAPNDPLNSFQEYTQVMGGASPDEWTPALKECLNAFTTSGAPLLETIDRILAVASGNSKTMATSLSSEISDLLIGKCASVFNVEITENEQGCSKEPWMTLDFEQRYDLLKEYLSTLPEALGIKPIRNGNVVSYFDLTIEEAVANFSRMVDLLKKEQDRSELATLLLSRFCESMPIKHYSGILDAFNILDIATCYDNYLVEFTSLNNNNDKISALAQAIQLTQWVHESVSSFLSVGLIQPKLFPGCYNLEKINSEFTAAALQRYVHITPVALPESQCLNNFKEGEPKHTLNDSLYHLVIHLGQGQPFDDQVRAFIQAQHAGNVDVEVNGIIQKANQGIAVELPYCLSATQSLGYIKNFRTAGGFVFYRKATPAQCSLP